MPGREEHKVAGGLAGGSTALAFAIEQPPLLTVVEVLGGVCGGAYAAGWPDILEPALSSHHRDSAHALGPVLLAGKVAFEQASSLQHSLRTQAAVCFQKAEGCSNGLEQLINLALGLVLHFAAGAVPGIPAGYLSHVALDAGTARGVPILTRGL